MTGKSTAWRALLVAVATGFALAGAAAADKLSGTQIKETVSGNTVEGTMEGTGDYAEFYQKDGTIKAQAYSGIWTIEGDDMCFQYGSDPKMCWEVARDGDTLQWIKDGKVEGTGKVAAGNPHQY
jgi:hypothetical protein